MSNRWHSLLVFAAVLLAALARYPATAQDSNSAKITSPKAGDSLFGLVNITGTANNSNFQRYILEFDQQDIQPDQWFPIAGPISQQVNNGVLGQWNTTTVPDARYQIRLRVVLRDGTVLEDIVQNLRVSNKQPTALPTLQPSATAPLPRASTAGPSPTPLVQQPPTSTPRAIVPSAVAAPPVVPPTEAVSSTPAEDLSPVVVAFTALQSAFCSGVYIALIAFVIYGLYSLVYSRLRPVLRRLYNQLRQE